MSNKVERIKERVEGLKYAPGVRIGTITESGVFTQNCNESGIFVLIPREGISGLINGCFYSFTAEIEIFQTKKERKPGDYVKIALVKKVSDIEVHDEKKMIHWSNYPVFKNNFPMLLFYNNKNIFKFNGENISGVCTVIKKIYFKTGNWDKVDYIISLDHGYKYSALSAQDQENSSFICKHDSFSSIAECLGLKCVEDEVVEVFLKENLQKIYNKYTNTVNEKLLLDNHKKIIFNDSVGERGRSPMLIFVKEDAIFEFTGQDIYGVCKVMSHFFKDGHNIYQIAVNKEFTAKFLREFLESGRFIDNIATLATMAEDLKCQEVQKEIVLDFIKKRFPIIWEYHKIVPKIGIY